MVGLRLMMCSFWLDGSDFGKPRKRCKSVIVREEELIECIYRVSLDASMQYSEPELALCSVFC